MTQASASASFADKQIDKASGVVRGERWKGLDELRLFWLCIIVSCVMQVTAPS